MKVSIDRAALQKALMKARGATAKSTERAVLRNFCIRALETGLLVITSTDLELAMVCELQASVEVPGAITTSAKLLFDVVAKAGYKEIVLEASAENLRISAGAYEAFLPIIPVEDFPPVEEFQQDNIICTNRQELLDAINKVSFSVSESESKANLMVVYIENNTVQASEGQVTSIATLQTPLNQLNIPAQAIKELVRVMTASQADMLEVCISEKFLMFRLGSDLFASRRTSAQFPSANKLLALTGTSPFYLKCERGVLAKALDRVSITASSRSNAVVFDISESKLVLSSFDQAGSSSREELPATWTVKDKGEEKPAASTKLIFNGEHLKDVCRSLQTDGFVMQVAVQINVPVRIEEPGFICLVMRLADVVLQSSDEKERPSAKPNATPDEL